jgi:hypothetical protein
MNIKKELNDWHKQMEEDFYPLDPVLFYWFIPFLIISLLFIYQQKINIMKKQQTAVEWLVEKMLNQDWYTYKSLEYIEQAKTMEKQQMSQADSNGYNRNQYNHDLEYGGSEYWEEIPQEFEQYYNETYKQEE